MWPMMPSSVQVGPFDYAVTVDDALPKHDTCYGHIDLRKQIIYLAPDQGSDQMADTLAHEVLHAVFRMMGRTDTNADEAVIGPLSPLLVDVLRRNPALVAFLVNVDA
jgi:hypothetical protein